jgi:spermidine synthase
MNARFEELGWHRSPMGEISLRRRFDPVVRKDVYEIKLDEEFLMSSLFPVAEIALARLGLARLSGSALDVVVGGLGLGYTAKAALEDDRLRALLVVEYDAAVLDWHRRELLPEAAGLAADPRVRLVHGDFFAAAATGFDPDRPEWTVDAVLLDIDHSPRHVLHEPHADFYSSAGLSALAERLRAGGVFAMWSDDPPDRDFVDLLASVFADVAAERVWFDNPFTGGRSSNTVYVASRR